MERRIPIYIVTGFLDSGKTTFIKTAYDKESLSGSTAVFGEQRRTLLIACEKGDEPYDEAWLESHDTVYINCKASELLVEDIFDAVSMDASIDRVIVECNGMYAHSIRYENFPQARGDIELHLEKKYCCVNAETIQLYNVNFGKLMTEHLRCSDLVDVNRIEPGADTAKIREIIRECTGRARIRYEFTDGTTKEEGNLRQNIYKERDGVMVVPNWAFAYLLCDIENNPEYYDGKTIECSGYARRDDHLGDGKVLFGSDIARFCQKDAEFQGLVCIGADKYFTDNGYKIDKPYKLTANVIIDEKGLRVPRGPVLDIKNLEGIQYLDEKVTYYF